TFNWSVPDALVDWALQQGMQVIVGPILDFSGHQLPDWLWERETDLFSLVGTLGGFVEQAVRRYHDRVRVWHLASGANQAGVLATRDEELLWLTTRLAETIRRINPQLEIVIGVAHPWGDYLAEQPRNYSPFVFAETILRTGLKLSALELEIVMGVT